MINLFEQISAVIGLPSGLLAALCAVESGHSPYAINLNDGGGTSSIGICQIKIETALEVMPSISPSDLFNPETNIMAAGLYLKKKLKKYKNVPHAVASYNAGRVKIDETGKLKNIRYVRSVYREWKRMRRKVSLLKVS